MPPLNEDLKTTESVSNLQLCDGEKQIYMTVLIWEAIDVLKSEIRYFLTDSNKQISYISQYYFSSMLTGNQTKLNYSTMVNHDLKGYCYKGNIS